VCAQIRALDSVINLVRSNCASIEACSSVGLQRDILRFLSDRGLFADPSISTAVLKKVLRLLLYLANHSVGIDDIRAMLGVFRSVRMEHEEPDDAAMRYYVSTLEMIARDSFGPASFFDLNGEFSGLLLPVLDSFPNNGYTFCAWIKFEVLPEVAAPLFTFWYVRVNGCSYGEERNVDRPRVCLCVAARLVWVSRVPSCDRL
jgi:hypothetical protein